ncbi:flagellin [Phenylobacterium sp.]|jgi:flagellar hook-associated protein 3 FlgL|uniref:flagellin n=1 Tax=Phenylobacterium sp. TaxID=1871053 RepID=UPI002F9580EC
MVTRVSTVGNYSAVLQNLLAAQSRQAEAGEQVATQKNGKDLKDYARSAEMLTGMRSLQTRLDVYAEQNKLIGDKLATQDMALNQMMEAANGARQAILDAIASDRADTLMEELNAHMRNAVEGANTRYGGKYLFAGGRVDTKPVTAQQTSDLTLPPGIIMLFFQNDTFKPQAKLDDSTTVTTGMLAHEILEPFLTGLQAVQGFHESVDGPFNGRLTDAQRTFLQGQLASWDTIRSDLTLDVGKNGLVRQRVDKVKDDLVTRQTTLAGMMGDIVDADMAKAAVNLEAAQMAVQSAAQVFLTLQSTSLLNFLK